MSLYMIVIVTFSCSLKPVVPFLLGDNPLLKVNQTIAAINHYISAAGLDMFDFGESEIGGMVFGWTLGPGRAGDLASIELVKEPFVNISYIKDGGVTVYQYHLLLGLRRLFFVSHYQFKTFEFSWGHTEVVLSSSKNSMDIECDVHLEKNGRCTAFLKNAIVRHIHINASVLPSSVLHYIMRGFIWLCSNLLVWRTMDSLNEIVQEIEQLNIPDSPFSDIVCKAFVK